MVKKYNKKQKDYKKYYHNSKNTHKKSKGNYISHKYKKRRNGIDFFKRGPGLRVTTIYMLLLLFVFVVFFALSGFIGAITIPYVNILMIAIGFISLIIGFYDSYRFIKYIERKLSNSDMSIWLRRILSIIMSGTGIILAFGFGLCASFLLAHQLTAAAHGGVMIFIAMPIVEMMFGFSLGLMFFSAYLEFTFEKRSGYLLYHGHQKF